MYLELTNACNMSCAHCCMNAVKHTGKAARYMTRAVIEKACAIAREYDEDITLGGGEPTLHPDFVFALGLAMLSAGEIGVLVVTNGSNEDLTLRMLDMNGDRFHCEVSIDSFHDISLVSQRVRTAATLKRAVRNNDHGIIAKGRGRSLSEEIRCACDTVHVSVNGDVHACGCRRRKDFIGNILDPGFDLGAANILGGECDGRKLVRP